MSKIRYFSEQHASKASQLSGAPVDVADSPEVAELLSALAHYSGDYNLYLQLARQLGRQLRYLEAIEVLTKAIELKPDSAEAYRRRAPRWFSTLRFDRALADYSYCDSQTPDSLDVLYRMGIVHVAMGDYRRAVEVMTRCIELTEGDGEMRVAVVFWYLSAYLRCRGDGEQNLALTAYRPGMEIGHHTSYCAAVELLCGDITLDEAYRAANEAVDDLDYSMVMYGVYLYHATRGEAAQARHAMDSLLERDFYWAGFAYICALADSKRDCCVPPKLREFFEQQGSVALAFSGGTDSAYLLYAAKSCGCRVKAYFAKSRFQPQFELDDARKLAAQLGLPLEVLELDILSNCTVAANPADRCYHCKLAIFTALRVAALRDGFELLVDGTNASDDVDDRPGMRALAELGVRSPLRECGVTKPFLRELSAAAGLFTYNKPSYACLATRVPTGREITATDLHRVEQGESLLADMGFTDLRLRLLAKGARLQLPENQLDRAVKMRQDICNGLSGYFEFVLLDLKPR